MGRARDDHRGWQIHDEALGLETFYASGETGRAVRADGEGGLLARGFYGRTPLVSTGPHSCRRHARLTAFYDHQRAEAEAPAEANTATEGAAP